METKQLSFITNVSRETIPKNVSRETTKKKDNKFYNYDIINREIAKEEKKGNKIALKVITSNRGDGKTTQTLLQQFIKNKENPDYQFGILFRTKIEVPSIESLITSFLELFPEYSGEITTKSYVQGLFVQVLRDGKTICWGFCLTKVDSLKKFSLMFTHVEEIIFDEYQKEDGEYLQNEIQKFLSVVTTIGRGQGKSSRPLQVTLLGNYVTLLNPYLIYLQVHKRIKADTKFLRGPNWICHFHLNEHAKQEMDENPLLRIFSETKYIKSSKEGVYLIDNEMFISNTPRGKNFNLCTIVYNDVYYGVFEFYNSGIVYVTNDSKVVDKKHNQLLAFNPNDHNQNTMLVDHYNFIYKSLKDYYHKGLMRFNDIETKNVMLDILSIDMYA